jgi:ubiquitin C-terminal hydrolase
VSKRVQFSETLALSRAVCGGREGARYRLAAVVEHIGSTPRSGHYVAYAQGGGAASWLRFDDTTVQPCSLQSVLARPAYILAYERVV